MTIIVAARLKTGGVCVAADSQWTAGWVKSDSATKVWTADPYVLGAAGSIRASQVIQADATWPKYRPDEDDATSAELWGVKNVVPAVRNALRDSGAMTTKDGRESFPGDLLVVRGETILVVWGNYAVTHHADRFAVGSGQSEALGFLGESGPWTVADVCEAARRATISAVGCGGKITYAVTTAIRKGVQEASA